MVVQSFFLVTAVLDCDACKLSAQCLKGPLKPNNGRGRQVTRFEPKAKDPANPSERMRQAIDSPRGRQLYSQRIGRHGGAGVWQHPAQQAPDPFESPGPCQGQHAVEPVLRGAQH